MSAKKQQKTSIKQEPPGPTPEGAVRTKAPGGRRRHRPLAEAIAPPAPLPEVPVAPIARPTKKAAVLTLLARPDGVSIDEIRAATGWLPHSVRALLTGFRKQGTAIHRAKDAAGVTRYAVGGR